MTEEDWKYEMLRRLWGGEETDPGKDTAKGGGNRRRSGMTWPSVDLHRYNELPRQLAEAEKAVDRAITDGYDGIVIIHGKGEDILRTQLIRVLQTHEHVAAFQPVKDAQGETGALKVRFR